jgi:uncharacterized membrane protein YqiK
VDFLSLALHRVEIEEACRSTEGIMLNLQAVVAFKVQSDKASVNAAAQRFLGEQRRGEMEEMTRRTFAGHLRSIVGEMPVVEIHRNRDALAQKILEHSQFEMSKFGLTVDSMQIEHLDDNNIGYLDDLAAETLADQKKTAEIARARAAQESQEAQQESARKQNQAIRETQLAQATIKSEVDQANAEAEAAGQLTAADVNRRVLVQQQLVADTNAELIERQLVGEQIKPTEAKARTIRIEADAQTSASEAAAKRAEFEAQARKISAVHAAEAQAETTRLAAEAARDAARYTAEATKANGQANADAREAEGKAEAKAIEAKGLAEAAGERAKADAVAANNGARLELARIEVQPEIAKAIAQGLGLNGANLNILNGGEGLAQIIGSIAPLVQMIGGLLKTHPDIQDDRDVQTRLDELEEARLG